MENKEQINIRNAHCAYFEGQTGLCRAKEFVRCNPVNCKLYTIDELSTILELQQKLQAKEQEIEKLNVIIDRFLVASGKSKDLTEPEDFERVFEDIEQTYSEHEDLKAENDEYRHAICEIGRLLSDALDTEKTDTDESFANF